MNGRLVLTLAKGKGAYLMEGRTILGIVRVEQAKPGSAKVSFEFDKSVEIYREDLIGKERSK